MGKLSPVELPTVVCREERRMNELTKEEAYAIANFIDMNLILSIRNDEETDSMMWLRNMIHGYEKLCKYSGYVGLTDEISVEIDD